MALRAPGYDHVQVSGAQITDLYNITSSTHPENEWVTVRLSAEQISVRAKGYSLGLKVSPLWRRFDYAFNPRTCGECIENT